MGQNCLFFWQLPIFMNTPWSLGHWIIGLIRGSVKAIMLGGFYAAKSLLTIHSLFLNIFVKNYGTINS